MPILIIRDSWPKIIRQSTENLICIKQKFIEVNALIVFCSSS